MTTYWKLHPRKFENEYTVSVASTPEDEEQYRAEGYIRISRELALRYLSRRPSSGETLYISAQLNGIEVQNRYDFARQLRSGRLTHIVTQF